jgi:hypothetical protein
MLPPGRGAAAITPLMAALVLVAAASAAGQTMGAQMTATWLSAFAAAAFAGAILRVAYQLNMPWWHAGVAGEIGPAPGDTQQIMAARNALLLAIGYAWGAASLLAVYLMTPLKWQHGWQYGLGMAIIAVAIFALSRWLPAQWTGNSFKVLTWASLLHGWAATGGLVFLIASAKIHSIKGDWAANFVFVAGAVVIAGVSAIALRTARFLELRRNLPLA